MERETKHLWMGLAVLLGSTVAPAWLMRALAQSYVPREGIFMMFFMGLVGAFVSMIVLYQVYPFKLARSGKARLPNVVIGFSLFAIFLTFFYGVQWVNGRFDGSEPQEEELFVMDKRMVGLGAEADFYLIVQDEDTTGGRRELPVSAEQFHRAAPASSIYRMRVRDGALGFEWVQESGVDRF